MFRGVVFFLAMAAFAPPASADFKGGERALGMLDYARALAQFRSALADGDPRALFEIGLIYERGQGVPADAARAARWYRKAVREAAGPAPEALARRALARVEGKDAPPPVASLPLPRPLVEAPAPMAPAQVAAKTAPPPEAPKALPRPLVEAPAPIVPAWVAANDSPAPSTASKPAALPGRVQFWAGPYGGEPPFFAKVLTPAGDLARGLANVAVIDDAAPAEARLWALRRGRDLFREGRYVEATPFIEKALELSDHQLGPEHEDTGALLHDLAKLMGIQGRNAEAEPLYKRSVDVFEKALGAEHARLAVSLDGLAGLYLVQGRLGDAEPLYRRSLAIREKALGPGHPLVAASLNNLAELYRGQGRFAEAEPLHKRSLAISEKALGPSHANGALT